MSILKILKISFLYIGTVIGAGFATGKELNVFFNNTSIVTIIFGGIWLGIFCSFYLYLGKVFKDSLSKVAFGKYFKIFDFFVMISVFFVFVAMYDTSDILIKQVFNISYGGVVTIIFTLLSAILGIGFIKKINFLVIPSVIAMIIAIFCKTPNINFGGSVNIFSGLFYAGMNIMLAGYIIKPEGENLSNKEIIYSGVIVSVVFAVVMLLLYEIVREDSSIMPLLTVSKKYNLEYVAGIIIYLSILTTALSSASVTIGYVDTIVNNKYLTSLIILLLAIPFKIYLGFDKIVNFVYPVVSVIGILVTIFSIIRIIIVKKPLKTNKNTKK